MFDCLAIVVAVHAICSAAIASLSWQPITVCRRPALSTRKDGPISAQSGQSFSVVLKSF